MLKNLEQSLATRYIFHKKIILYFDMRKKKIHIRFRNGKIRMFVVKTFEKKSETKKNTVRKMKIICVH